MHLPEIGKENQSQLAAIAQAVRTLVDTLKKLNDLNPYPFRIMQAAENFADAREKPMSFSGQTGVSKQGEVFTLTRDGAYTLGLPIIKASLDQTRRSDGVVGSLIEIGSTSNASSPYNHEVLPGVSNIYIWQDGKIEVFANQWREIISEETQELLNIFLSSKQRIEDILLRHMSQPPVEAKKASDENGANLQEELTDKVAALLRTIIQKETSHAGYDPFNHDATVKAVLDGALEAMDDFQHQVDDDNERGEKEYARRYHQARHEPQAQIDSPGQQVEDQEVSKNTIITSSENNQGSIEQRARSTIRAFIDDVLKANLVSPQYPSMKPEDFLYRLRLGLLKAVPIIRKEKHTTIQPETEIIEHDPKSHLRIVIANMTEDVYDFVSKMAPNDQAVEIAENAGLSERELFNDSRDNTVFVLPVKPDEAFLKYYQQLFGLEVKPMVLTPRDHTGVICADVIKDETLMNELRSLVSTTPSTELVSYASTRPFYQLAEVLHNTVSENNHLLYLPESAYDIQDADIGSKSFTRQIFNGNKQNDAGFTMPEGQIFPDNINAAVEYASTIYLQDHSVVVKINKGHGGAGVLIFREGDLPSTSTAECSEALLAKMHDAYWREAPIVVEKCVDADKSVGGGFPSVEFFIDQNGPHFLYACGMLMTPEGVFQGVEINNQVFSADVEAKMKRAGEFVSQKIAETGYRGYHDLDLIVGKDGTVYVDEANLRRTGGTHVHNTARELFGDDYINKTAIIAENTYVFHKYDQPSFKEVHDLLIPLLYNPDTQTGIVLCGSQSLKQNKLAYIIFAPTPEEARNIRQQMVQLVG